MSYFCKICGNSSQNTSYIVREMMFGYRDEFEYFQCANCECLQIGKIPENLEKYYPIDYYSFARPKHSKRKYVKWLLKRQRTRFFLNRNGRPTNRFFSKWFKPPHLPDWIIPSAVDIDSRILDVGCGNGRLLNHLYKKGFSNLTGFDPYIREKMTYSNGVKIFNGHIGELKGPFDLIMLHHSFEHVAEPVVTLKDIYHILGKNGRLLIRVPLVSSYAWQKYKTHWVQLDAPRHLFLYSVKSLELVSKEAGFEIEFLAYDSNALQFWGSEQYLQDIPLLDPVSFKYGLEKSIFTEKMINDFQVESKVLNASKRGDQACFIFKKIVSGSE